MTPKQANYELLAKTVIKALAKRQMDGYYCATKEEAVSKALKLMPKGSSVAWGGSMTINECGLLDAVKEGSYDVIDRDKAKSPEEKRKLAGEIMCSDYFLMSTNAITSDGELVNIDGFGSRVAYLIYGPQNVIIVAGMNKVSSDMDSAVRRARNTAAPMNTVRLNRKTPCTSTGKCENCYAADCICSQFVVTRRSSIPGRIKVILVGEELGY